MVNAVESLKAGAKGLSCIQGNFFPELIVWLCENYDKPESSAQVEKLQKFLTANMDVMHAAYPTIAKYFLCRRAVLRNRSEEHTSELQSLMRNSYAVFCLKKKKNTQ